MNDGFTFATIRGEPPVDVVRAVRVRHAFRRHLHRQGVVCRIDAGIRRYSLAGAEGLAVAGHVMVIPPGVPHACEPGGGETCSYRVISWAGPFPAAPFVARDRRLRAAFDGAFRRLREGDPSGAEDLVAVLLRRPQAAATPARREGAGVDRVRALLEERHAEPLPLRTLAEAARMSPFALHRAFRERFGLPPHEYQLLVRVKRAQDLLRGDAARPLAALALDLGFADQAHLTRLFKQYVGVPPGRWRSAGYRASRNPCARP